MDRGAGGPGRGVDAAQRAVVVGPAATRRRLVLRPVHPALQRADDGRGDHRRAGTALHPAHGLPLLPRGAALVAAVDGRAVLRGARDAGLGGDAVASESSPVADAGRVAVVGAVRRPDPADGGAVLLPGLLQRPQGVHRLVGPELSGPRPRLQRLGGPLHADRGLRPPHPHGRRVVDRYAAGARGAVARADRAVGA
ncbi:hypothetical protein BQ8420_10420 [Nocardiopsis sp. JB363]|nr:hypothetical protein BQ8420_10420 [Nocardiopsis sp. JB363]